MTEEPPQQPKQQGWAEWNWQGRVAYCVFMAIGLWEMYRIHCWYNRFVAVHFHG